MSQQFVPMPGPRGRQQGWYNPNTGGVASNQQVYQPQGMSWAPPSFIPEGGGQQFGVEPNYQSPPYVGGDIYNDGDIYNPNASGPGGDIGIPSVYPNQQSPANPTPPVNIFGQQPVPGAPTGMTTNSTLNIDDVGSTSTEGNMPYWIAQLQNGTEQQKALYGLLANLYQTQGDVNIADIGADASKYGEDQRLAGSKYGADANTEQARIAAQAQQAVADLNQTQYRLQDSWRREQMPALMSFVNRNMGTPSSAALAAFSPQNEQAALNSSEAAAARTAAEQRRANALQYSGDGFSVNSPAVLARNAASDAAAVGNRLSAQQQIRNDYGNNRGQMAIAAQNANTNQMSPIISLLSKLFG